MNKILIALALASIFVVAQSAVAAVVCNKQDGTADSNCLKCPNNSPGTCTQCGPGFFVSTTAATLGTCLACGDTLAAGCNTCTSATAGSCTSAIAGWFIATAPGSPVQCTDTNCAVCSMAGATKCTTCNPGYFLAGAVTPSTCTICGDTLAAGCKTCTSGVAGSCTAATTGWILPTNPGTPAQCTDTGCAVCGTPVAAALGTPGAGKCTVANSGYATLTTAAAPTICGDFAGNCAVCSPAATCTTCNKGTPDSAGLCCGVKNCGTCGALANNVCATPSTGYGLVSNGASTAACTAGCARCDGGATATIGACTACSTGFTNTAANGVSPFVCVATTPVPSTNSPSTASFNVTPTAVFLSTETSTPAFTGQSGAVLYGPGFDSSTEYVWAIVSPTLVTGTYVVNRRALNGTYGGSLAKLNSSDTSITTAIPSGALAGTAVAPGYLALASSVDPTNWGGVNGLGAVAAATIGEISITYIAVNGTSATTKALTGNTNANAYFEVQNLWIDTGVIYCTYTMSTHTPGTAAAGGTAATADVWALNGIYIQAVVISSGALLYNTTGGIKAITLTQSTSGSPVGCVNQVGTGCVSSAPSSAVSNFIVCGNNITNSSAVNYLWQDASVAPSVIKTGTITLATGAGTAGTVLNTDVAAVGTASVAVPTVATSYTVGGCLGSFATYGVFVSKAVTTDTGVALTGATTVYSTVAYINGTVSSNITATSVSGYRSPTIQGYGTSDGFILVEQHRAQTTPTNGQNKLIQIERFFTNGTMDGAAVNLGTYYDTPSYHQDANGSIYIGYTVSDTNTGKSYAGYLGKYLAQTLASGASTLTSIFTFLSIMIMVIFAL